MPRLFWKFFATIWLSLAATVAAIILILSALHVLPIAPELELQKRDIVLNLTENVLARDGEEAASRFVRTSEDTVPLGLAISRDTELGACAEANGADTRSVMKDGTCYRISIAEQQASMVVLENFALLIPWLAILVSSTISAAAIARYLIRPVVHLRDGLSALASGRFDVRIGDKTAGRRDEVTALAHDFDSTAARLQELQETQQQLFHDVSHELRSPLSRLQAVVGVLRQNPAKLEAMLDRMDHEIGRLDGLVGEVLTLARLTAGSSLPLKTQRLDVIDLLNEILGDATFEAQARGVSITASVEGAFLADVEGELIYRALENVVRNAVKYTGEHSRIVVRCDAMADLLRVSVTDQGPGVGSDDLERIFQPFSRGGQGVPRGGYGLGLAITRQAVKRHGGRVYASLPTVGGLTVTLELPRNPTANVQANDPA
jgi:two-component system OmpR family sensor kinase